MKFKQVCGTGVLALLALYSVMAPVRADDDQDAKAKEKPPVIKKRIEIKQPLQIIAQADNKHWIGVYALPVEAALKSHLGIEDCLIVKEVIDDGPAKKAGIQEHDILLKYGDVSLTTVDDLIQAVGKAEEKETSVELIRGGKKMKIKVTGAERPADQVGVRVKAADVGDVRGLLGEWIQSQGLGKNDGSPLRFRVVGPGAVDHDVDVKKLHQAIIAGKGKLPKNLSIQINKNGDEPAKIKVTRDGKTWDVTEDSLDKLPAEIRGHVKQSLGGKPGVAFGFAPNGKAMQLKMLQILPGGELSTIVSPHAIRVESDATSKGRQIRIKTQVGDSTVDVEQLRKDVDDLKAAVKKLQAGKPRKKSKDD